MYEKEKLSLCNLVVVLVKYPFMKGGVRVKEKHIEKGGERYEYKKRIHKGFDTIKSEQ